VMIIRMFPSTMTTYNTEKKRKKKSWSSWELESPNNMNSDTTEELVLSMQAVDLLWDNPKAGEIKRNWICELRTTLIRRILVSQT
jgi:hypothetical protein